MGQINHIFKDTPYVMGAIGILLAFFVNNDIIEVLEVIKRVDG